MEDNNLDPIQNENETTIVRDENMPDKSNSTGAEDKAWSPEHMDQELGINKKALIGLGTGAAVVGGAIYLSANDAAMWNELYKYFNQDIEPDIVSEPSVDHDLVKNDVPKELYDEKGKVVYVKPIENETQLSEFGQAFKTAREAGLQQFEWNGNFYHTKLREEMPDYIGNNKGYSDQGQIANLDSRVSNIEYKLGIPSDEQLKEKGRVASSILDQTGIDNKNAAYGFADENHDGIKDTIAIDTNHDRKIDRIYMDTNYDVKFDTVMIDSNKDGVLDIQIVDTEFNGLTEDDQSEEINYEININEYESMDENDDSLNQLDTLDSIF
jgi:hypothetical protein